MLMNVCVWQLNGGAKQRDFKRLLTMRLQRVESSELIEFPENEEGYLGKIRWYSFQFLMQVTLTPSTCSLQHV